MPEAEDLKHLLAGRVDLAGLYICGPFDQAGRPASPDIHVLAVARQSGYRDLHFVPGVADVVRRTEVSVVPLGELEAAVARGITTWPAFYSLDKLMKSIPILEAPDLEALRGRAGRGLRLKPSLHAGTMRDLLSRVKASRRCEAAGPMAVLAANAALLAAMALRASLRGGQTFSRLSEIAASPEGGAASPKGEAAGQGDAAAAEAGANPKPPSAHPWDNVAAGRMIAAAERFIREVLKAEGVDVARFAQPARTERGERT